MTARTIEPLLPGGLTTDEASRRLAQWGPNTLVPEPARSGVGGMLRRALTDPMTLLLLVAAPTYLFLRDYVSAAVIAAALVPVTLITVLLEARAEHALEQLNRRSAPTARARRDGDFVVIPARELVPGDVVEVREGDVVPADGPLGDVAQMTVDEAALTGESYPVAKDVADAVYAGTNVVSGRGAFEVSETGTRTRYGQVGALLATSGRAWTPLQRLVRRLVIVLGAVAGALCVFVAGLELLRGETWEAAVIAGVSLGIATVPEEIPLVYTLYLALGARRLAQEHALVRRLAAVETLGSTTVICTDKTGTLTLGRVEVATVVTADGRRHDGASSAASRALLAAAVLASEPDPFDPLELAIVRFAETHDVSAGRLHRGELVRDYPFDARGKYLSHVWRTDGKTRVYAKGALEGILERSHASGEERAAALAANGQLADAGMRVIGVAAGDVPALGADRESDEGHLHFAGLVAFRDPLRPGVAAALTRCVEAGIRVVMITGDHPVTAHSVAEGLGLPHDDEGIATGEELMAADDEELLRMARSCNIFARTAPEQKHRLVQALRAESQVVAMTGDGINDAPALREADIGVAMGQRGTQVARESASLVLLDDNFSTIVTAAREGRRIFANLQHAFAYLVSFHTPLVLAALLVPLTGEPLLLLPVHLILLQIIVHPTASLVFEGDPPSERVMHEPPRSPHAGILTRPRLLESLARGLTLSAAVIGVYLVRVQQSGGTSSARSIAFATLLLGQTVLVLVERSDPEPVWRVGSRGNRVIGVVLAATLAMVLGSFLVPGLRGLLHVAPLSPIGWLTAAGLALLATMWWEPVKALRGAGHDA